MRASMSRASDLRATNDASQVMGIFTAKRAVVELSFPPFSYISTGDGSRRYGWL